MGMFKKRVKASLENFGVDVDPIQKRLKPIQAMIGGFLASSSKP
jgi:hypothetical protein